MPRIGAIRAGNPESWIANGSNMFVDAVDGNDSDDGLSPPRAKQTYAGVLAASPGAGIKVYFKDDQKHNAPIATFAANCEFTNYGHGTHIPIIWQMAEIRGVAADWVEVNTSAVPTAGTHIWRTDLFARGIDVHATAAHRARVVVNDGGWLPTDYQLNVIMSGASGGSSTDLQFLTAEGNWRAHIPTTAANQFVNIYSDNPDVPGLDNPADRWTSIGVGKFPSAATVGAGHTGTIFRNLRFMGGNAAIAVSEECTTYDCQFDNAGAVNMSLIEPKNQTHYRPKIYRCGTSSSGTEGVKFNLTDITSTVDYTATFWDADIAFAAEDCVLLQSAGINAHAQFLSTYPGATMVGSCGDGENPFDIKLASIKVQGAIAVTSGGEYQPITVQGGALKIELDNVFFSALQTKAAINGQETTNYFRITRSLLYAANVNVAAFWQSGGGAAKEKSILEGNIFYAHGSSNGAGIFSEAHHFKLRHNMFISKTTQGAFTSALSRRAKSDDGIALIKHDGVDSGGYGATAYTTNLTLGAAWADTHSITLASNVTASTGWNGTFAIDTVGLDATGKYYYATFRLPVVSAGAQQPQVCGLLSASVPAVTINSVSQPISFAGTSKWITAAECFATSGGFQTIRIYENVNDYVMPLGANIYIAGAPTGYTAINGSHEMVAAYSAPNAENGWGEFQIAAASQVNGGVAGMIDVTTLSSCFPCSYHAVEGNMFICDGSTANGNPAWGFDLQSVFEIPAGANYYHLRVADFPIKTYNGGTGAVNYTTAQMTGTGAGTVFAATGGNVGNNASDKFETAAFDSCPSKTITSLTIDAVARLATVGYTAHGLTVGHPVVLEAQGTTLLRGAKPVHSVPDANHFTVRIPYEVAMLGNFTEATPGTFVDFKVPVGSKALNAAPVVTFDLLTTDIAGIAFDATPHFGPLQIAA